MFPLEWSKHMYRSISLPPPAFTHFLSWRRRDGLLSLLSPGFVSIVIIREQFFFLHRLVSFALGFCMAVASHMPAAFGPHSYLYRCFFRRTGQFLVEVFFSLAPFFFSFCWPIRSSAWRTGWWRACTGLRTSASSGPCASPSRWIDYVCLGYVPRHR